MTRAEGTECVFVNPDGTVERRVIERNLVDRYEQPVSRPFDATYRLDRLAAAPVRCDRVIYTRKGRMFDGRPVFCADGWDAQAAAMAVTAAERDREQATEQLCRAVAGLIRNRSPKAIPLDSWEGEPRYLLAHERDELAAAGLCIVERRELVAVPVERL